jgi:hypothetical protein
VVEWKHHHRKEYKMKKLTRILFKQWKGWNKETLIQIVGVKKYHISNLEYLMDKLGMVIPNQVLVLWEI